jgi:hypothetical protein
MRTALLLTVFSLALTPLAQAQQAKEPSFPAERVKAHVEFLSDDLLEGRNAGTRGYDLAARYVATQFEGLGLKPGGPKGSWYQQVPLSSFELQAASPAFLSVGTAKFANGTDVLIGATPRVGTGTQTETADAVFVGYGLDSDYEGLDLKGKIAVALIGVPNGLQGPAAEAARGEDKTQNAGKHGAIGLVHIVPAGATFPWDQAASYYMRSQYTWLGPDGTPGGLDARVRIGGYVKDKAAAALFEGAPTDAAKLYASLATTRPKGFPLARKVTLSRTSTVTTAASPNVIGVLPGSDPKLAKEYVLVMAHLDHDGVDPKLSGDKIYNGAMDNAAGTATMLEAARAFVESGVRPKRSILFVAVTAEEDGLLGSQYLAKYPVVGDGKLVGVVNLDMPILLYDFQDVVAFGAEHSTLGPIVARAAGRFGVTLSPDPLPEENLFTRSDHYSFVQAGVPSVFLMTGFKNGGEKAFKEFLATHYHKPSDQTNLPFNWEAGAKFARINYLIAREIADSPDAPRWYEGNPYGDRFAPGQPRAPKPKE